MLNSRVLSLFLGISVLCSNGIATAQTPVEIDIMFSGDTSFQPLFDNAALIWESILPSYQDGTTGFGPFASPIGPIVVDAGVSAIDGPNGTLAFAGPSSGTTDNGGFFVTTEGDLQFDSADIDTLAADGNLQDIIVHELGHVLGFGTLWVANDVFDGTSSDTSVGEYTGNFGVVTYNQEFGLDEAFVPIENNGGPGTANGHFDEEFFGVALNSDPTVDAPAGSSSVQEFRFGPNEGELLTGVFRPGVDLFLSDTTAATFQDIGFNVDFAAVEAFNNGDFDLAAVPEPSSASLLLLTLAAYGFRRRRS